MEHIHIYLFILQIVPVFPRETFDLVNMAVMTSEMARDMEKGQEIKRQTTKTGQRYRSRCGQSICAFVIKTLYMYILALFEVHVV